MKEFWVNLKACLVLSNQYCPNVVWERLGFGLFDFMATPWLSLLWTTIVVHDKLFSNQHFICMTYCSVVLANYCCCINIGSNIGPSIVLYWNSICKKYHIGGQYYNCPIDTFHCQQRWTEDIGKSWMAKATSLILPCFIPQYVQCILHVSKTIGDKQN